MKTIKIVLPLLPVLIFIGCFVTKVDSITEFNINGKILNKNDGKPIKNAKLFFVDKGFDSYRANIENALEVGLSDESGAVNKDFEYFWGYDKSWFKIGPSEEFEIVITKDEYTEMRIFFKRSVLKVVDDKVFVPIGEIYLEKKN